MRTSGMVRQFHQNAMRILITNNRLDYRGGAESFVGDLARGLQAEGHQVMAYSSDPGRRPRMLEHDAIPVTTDPLALPFKPDIIHAQHHLDAMTAIASLPGVPAIYHCHGAVWKECVPIHPRIRHYLAMSSFLRERMVVERNIAPDKIDVLHNSVDTARFRTVCTPPPSISRALFYNGSHLPGGSTTEAVSRACTSLGIHLDFIGKYFSRSVPDPENVLHGYDLVFASGRSAIDALASGCAVIVLGRNSCGPLVCVDNFSALRDSNFSIAANCPPPDPANVIESIRSYDPAQAAAVTARTRDEADSKRMVARLLPLYQRVIDDHRGRPTDPAAEATALANYLRELTPVIKIVDDMQRRQNMPLSIVEAHRTLDLHLDAMQRTPPPPLRG